MSLETKHYTHQFYKTTAAAWQAMYQAILGAQKSIFWEVYIFLDDRVGEQFARALCDKAKTGVEIKMVIDAWGSRALSNIALDMLKAAGVEVRRYNYFLPILPISNWINRLFHRNHRKALIVDENIVFLGGVNIHVQAEKWYDVYLKISGEKLAWPLLRGFAKSYISSGGDRKKVYRLLHPKLTGEWPELKQKLRFILHTPLRARRNSLRKLYIEAVETAKESINFLTPYYIPDKKFLKAVRRARARGVKINIYLPLRLDLRIMEWAARAYYALTQQSGADIYLMRHLHHGKAMSVDGRRGIVGSMNLTRRSFFMDQESGVYFNDEQMARDLNELFNDYKNDSDLVDKEIWRQRSWLSRIEEWLATRLERYM